MSNSLNPPNPYLFPLSVARLATPDDIAILAQNLRPECALELIASTGHSPLDVLTADLSRTWIISDREGMPLASLLVSPYPDNHRHCILQIAVSETVSKHHYARTVVAQIIEASLALHRAGYDEVHSLVDARNVPTATLLTGCGFSFEQRYDSFGAQGRPFCHYTSRIKAAAETLH